MSWAGLTLATDADLGALESEATAPDAPWGQSSWQTQLDGAKKELGIWIDTDFPETPMASDRIRDRWAAEKVFAETGGTFTDYSVEARDDTEEDIDIEAVYATPGSDYLYVGALWTYHGLFVHMLDSVNANASVLTVAYWAKDQWQTVPAQSDGTIAAAGKTLGQSGRVTFATPTDWERRSLNSTGEEYYWTRLSINNALTSGTSISHLLSLRQTDNLTLVHTYLTLSYIFGGLARQSTDPEGWREQSNAYRTMAVELYERLKLKGGIPMDDDMSGAVEPPAETAEILGNVRFLRG